MNSARRMGFIIFAFTCAAMFVSAPQLAGAERPRIVMLPKTLPISAGELQTIMAVVTVDPETFSASTIEGVQIRLVQNGNTYPALIRSVIIHTETNPAAIDLGASGNLISVTYSVPDGMRDGAADLILTYRKTEGEPHPIQISSMPGMPMFALGKQLVLGDQGPTPPPPGSTPPPLDLVRGKKSEISVIPIMDPERKDSGILLTLRQDGRSIEVPATVDVLTSSSRESMSSPRYRVMADIPADLNPGPAVLVARNRSGTQLSPAAECRVNVLASDSPVFEKQGRPPKIANVFPTRPGRGQSVQIVVAEARMLLPVPSDAKVVVVSAGQRVTLDPKWNTATERAQSDPIMPAVLLIRLPEELLGKANLQISNPNLPQGGLSEAVPIEILDEVVPPEVTNVSESSERDLMPLRMMWSRLKEAGQEFENFNPASRYVTIRARNLDMDPAGVFVQFKQGNNTVTLDDADFSMTMGTFLIVRIPGSILQGRAEVTVANRVGSRLSSPWIGVIEVSR